MLSIRVSELEGDALDFAVAKCIDRGARIVGRRPLAMLISGVIHAPWSPSTDGNQSGPLMDERSVSTVLMGEPLEWHGLIGVYFDGNNDLRGDFEQTGPTRSIAACRTIVAAELGDNVMLPPEFDTTSQRA